MSKNIGQIKPVEIIEEMQSAYLDYAMSVIMSRAIPDARDGLKPVHRRILVTLNDLKLTARSRFRKSAKICGDVSGNYHPHGEAIVYPSMALLAQDFKMRYPLVDGQGNWGSIDGDPPAAMRYTEARMTKLAEEMLKDLEKETVDFRPNYDSSRQEPVVLSTRIPQLLLNGTMGIAVGMATNIPPHNLSELVLGLIHLLERPETQIRELMEFIQGPDFPTGGVIYSQKDILSAYETGRGGVVMRGKATIKDRKIIITEIPFQVNKSSLVEKIASLAQSKKIEGIRDLRDESDRLGMRIVVELKKDAFPEKILNKLYSLTDLQKRFNFNMLALVNGLQPKVLSLKEMMEEFLKHRREVVRRRAVYELKLAEARLHILAGLHQALDQIDEIISLIRGSKNKEEAKLKLIKKFAFSFLQTEAILELRLQSLASLEREVIKAELEEKRKLISELRDLLGDQKKITAKIIQELGGINTEFGGARRTRVVKNAVSQFKEEDLIPDEDTVIISTDGGYIKRVNPKIYRVQHRGGKGVMAITTRGDDVITNFISARTHDRLLFFTSLGRVFEIMAYEIPEGSRIAKGQALVNFLGMESGEELTAILPAKEKSKFLIMATKKGFIKKTLAKIFESVRRSGLKAINLEPDDTLKWVRAVSSLEEIILTSSNGQAIRFLETDTRVMSRGARGVRGIRLKKDDYLIFMDVIRGHELMVISKNGYGKKSSLSQYKLQKRGGRGIKTLTVNAKTGSLAAGLVLRADSQLDLVATSEKGQVIRIHQSAVPLMGRATQGVRLMRLKPRDNVLSIARL